MKSNKSTDTLQSIEERWHKEIAVIKDPDSDVDQKKEANKRAKYLEDFMNTVNYKHINGKTEQDRSDYILKDDKPMNKEEILKLIKDVETDVPVEIQITTKDYIRAKEIDLSGVFLPDSLKD